MQSIAISDCQSGLIENISISKISTLRIQGKEIRFRTQSISNDMELELYDSIKANGLLNPIIVRCKKDDTYEVISGRRRIEAFKRLGLRKILCHVLDIDDKKAYEIAIIENIQSIRINPIEEAQVFKSYVEEFGWGGISDLAKKISKSVSYVDRRIKLLELPEDIKNEIIEGTLKPSIADELSAIKDADERSYFATVIKEKSPSLREIRQIVKNGKNNINCQVASRDTDESIDSRIIDPEEKTQRSFNQAIMAIRIAMNKLTSIIDNSEDNGRTYKILMEHKRVLHDQIDILYKEKKEIKRYKPALIIL